MKIIPEHIDFLLLVFFVSGRTSPSLVSVLSETEFSLEKNTGTFLGETLQWYHLIFQQILFIP
jgi:hypothetical protein